MHPSLGVVLGEGVGESELIMRFGDVSVVVGQMLFLDFETLIKVVDGGVIGLRLQRHFAQCQETIGSLDLLLFRLRALKDERNCRGRKETVIKTQGNKMRVWMRAWIISAVFIFSCQASLT